jgi:hypothetical protein
LSRSYSYAHLFILALIYSIFDCIRNDVSNFCRYHPNNPIAVSPHWIIASLKKKSLQQPNLFPPIHIKPQLHHVKSVNHQNNNSSLLTKNKTQDETIKDELFKGAIFHFVHSNKKQIHYNSSSNSNSNNRITFDLNKVKKLVTTNGGHILSQQTVVALQKENDNTKNKRICYIVNISNKHSYEYVHNDVVNNNTLLSKIYIERLCTLIPVTPIWIETCIAGQMECQPEKYPQLFQPLWPMYKLPSLTTTSAKLKVKVSVSGFQNSQRIGLKQMLIAIGAKYTDNMGNTNTHLICKEAKGPKYHKAIEWGLHVVTIDWLYHIVRYGYGGKYETRSGSNGKGCEKRFQLSFSPKRVQPVFNNDGMDNIQNDEVFK